MIKFIGVAFESWNIEAQKFTDYIEALNWYNRQDNDRPKYLCTVIETNQTEKEKSNPSMEGFMTMTLQEFKDRFGWSDDNWAIINYNPWTLNEGADPKALIKINWNKASKLGIYLAEYNARRIVGV